jgi:hypothetical protein
MQTVKQLGDRLAQEGHPLKPRTIQTALGELEAAGLAAGSEEGNGRARFWSPTTPTWMPTAPAMVNRAMGERLWHDPPWRRAGSRPGRTRPGKLAWRVGSPRRH